MSPRRRPRAYFSFRSPFSWMAMDKLLASPHRDDVDLIPFWDPDPRTEQLVAARGASLHYVQMSKAKHLYILQDTKRAAAALGHQMVWPVDRSPWWEVPHLAWLQARRDGCADVLYRVLIAARWTRGEDICMQHDLAAIADAAGLNGSALARAVDDESIRDEAAECLVAAYHDDVFGIPYFLVGPHRFWGLDRVDQFLAVLDGATGPAPRAEIPPAVRAAVGSFDSDTAGGCG